MHRLCVVLGLIGLFLTPAMLRGDDSPPRAESSPESVSELIKTHDQALVRDLIEYLRKNPKADDSDQAYMTLFEKAIDHDWFAETEATAKLYLAANPDGAVRPLAQIVSTMARAQAGKFTEAWEIYRHLLKSLDRDDQQEFAANFADSLANAASAAGEYGVARKVYEALLEKYADKSALADKVRDDLARIAMVGKPAPVAVAKDIHGNVFRLSDLKGRYVLMDFWATWCGPCLAELPNLQAAYEKYRKKGLEVVAVSLDETAPPVLDFVKSRQLTWKQIHNGTCGTDLVEAFGVNNIPATFLVGPEGTIVRLELRGPSLEKALSQLLK
jgi:thiol-disulfide isomerase/thioredoxin